jgi:hypothetical protein
MTQLPIRTRGAECVSDLQLDARFTGELEPEVAAQMDAHLEGCERCRVRMARLERARSAFLAPGPVFERPGPRRPSPSGLRRLRPRWLMPLSAGAALAAALALAFLPPRESGEPALRSKGGERIGLFIKRGALVRRGASGAHVQPGDQLRFTYSTDVDRYLAIVSIDGAGKRSLYFPDGARAARVERADDQPLSSSIVLDDVLGRERVIALFCARPIELAPLLAGSERPWAVPQSCRAAEPILIKEAAPR